MSLRTIHVLFILVVVVTADLFGAWAVRQHAQSPDTVLLVTGMLSFVAGFAAIAYGIWFVRKADRAHIE